VENGVETLSAGLSLVDSIFLLADFFHRLNFSVPVSPSRRFFSLQSKPNNGLLFQKLLLLLLLPTRAVSSVFYLEENAIVDGFLR